MAESPLHSLDNGGRADKNPSDSTDGRVPRFQVQPKEGTLRALTANPPPYVHPRILFSEDRGDLERTAHQTNVGSVAFNQLSSWVDKVVYDAQSPIKRLLDALTSTISDQKPYGDPSNGFDAIKELVTDREKGGAVLLGSFYGQLFEIGKTPPCLGPAELNVMQSNPFLVKPPQKDTSAEMGAKVRWDWPVVVEGECRNKCSSRRCRLSDGHSVKATPQHLPAVKCSGGTKHRFMASC